MFSSNFRLPLFAITIAYGLCLLVGYMLIRLFELRKARESGV
jgi:hypothetical protein